MLNIYRALAVSPRPRTQACHGSVLQLSEEPLAGHADHGTASPLGRSVCKASSAVFHGYGVTSPLRMLHHCHQRNAEGPETALASRVFALLLLFSSLLCARRPRLSPLLGLCRAAASAAKVVGFTSRRWVSLWWDRNRRSCFVAVSLSSSLARGCMARGPWSDAEGLN